jgi:type III pantothenate kinase
MACGVPIVATRAGGVPYVVGEAGGRLVPPRDPAALADALVEVLTSPPLQRAMGRQNRERLEDHFEVEGAVDRLEAAYAAILRASRSNRSGRVRPAPVNASGSSGRRWHGNWP